MKTVKFSETSDYVLTDFVIRLDVCCFLFPAVACDAKEPF